MTLQQLKITPLLCLLLILVLMMSIWRLSRSNSVCPLIFFSHCLSHSFFLAAAQKTWRSPVYSFFKANVAVEIHKGHVSHFFTCSAAKCKSNIGGVRHFQDKADKSSTANLRHHAIRCFGDEAVNSAVKGKPAVSQSGNIFSSFAGQGQ